jgi:hypothetical protein
MEKTSKSKNPLFVRQSRIWLRQTSLRPCAGLVSKKGQAELALFWSKSKATH